VLIAVRERPAKSPNTPGNEITQRRIFWRGPARSAHRRGVGAKGAQRDADGVRSRTKAAIAMRTSTTSEVGTPGIDQLIAAVSHSDSIPPASAARYRRFRFQMKEAPKVTTIAGILRNWIKAPSAQYVMSAPANDNIPDARRVDGEGWR